MALEQEFAQPGPEVLQHLHELFEQAEEGILVLDPDLRLRYMNPAGRQYCGLDRELVGKHPWRAKALANCNLEENCRRAVTEKVSLTYEAELLNRRVNFRVQPTAHGGAYIWARDNSREYRGAQAQQWILDAVTAEAELFVSILQGPELRFESANARVAALSPNRSVLGRTVAEVFPDLTDTHLLPLREVLQTGRAFRAVNMAFRSRGQEGSPADESYFNLACLAIPSAEPTGATERILVLIHETTQQVLLSRRAEQLAAGTEAIFANITDAVFIADCDGHILSVNPAAVAMSGYEHSEEMRRGTKEFRDFELRTLDGRVLPVDEWPLARIARGETLSAIELEIRHPGQDRMVYASCSGALARDSSGHPQFAVLIARDITQNKHFERALRTSEERRLLALEAAGMGAWNHELETNSIHLSPRCREIYGLGPDEEADAAKILRSIHPDDRQAISDAHQQALLEHSDFEGEFRLYWPDGTEHWIASRGRASYDANGRAVLMQGVSHDITRRKLTEGALQRSTENLRAVIDACPLPVLTVNSIGAIETWNACAEKTFGWSEAEVTGRQPPCIPEDLEPEYGAAVRRVMTGETVWALERTGQKKSGGPVLVSISIAPLRNSSGEIHGAVMVMDDVTEARMIERKLQQTQKLESLGVLAGGVAHDFNNLLTAILGNASLAASGMLDSDPSRRLLEEVIRISKRAADLTRQLLAYAGKGHFMIVGVDLSSRVKDVYEFLRGGIPNHVHFIFDLPPDLPAVEGDPTQIEHVIMNLVVNAVEAMEGQEEGTILVATRLVEIEQEPLGGYVNGESITPGPFISLEVHDTGCGMDETTRLCVFDPFFSTKFTGRGLGLSAVLGIVRSHKGALLLSSKPGGGASFTILFPVSAASVEPPRVPENQATLLVTGGSSSKDMALRAALSDAGLHVADNSDSETLSAILLDLESEEQFALLRSRYPTVPIFVCTSYSEREAIHVFPKWAVAGFLQKPYTAAQVIRRLRSGLV